jgi:predicted O-linked N-acetylglucosamine transferase (SPINDLY family)
MKSQLMRQDYGEWFARGRAHQEAGRPIDAMVCYRRALNSNAQAVQARFRLGEVLRELGREDEARATWRAGLALNPGHLRLILSLAEAARHTGAYAEAIDGYRRVLAGQPDLAAAHLGLALAKIAIGDEAACAEFGALLRDRAPARRWDEVASALAAAPPSAGKRVLLLDLAAERKQELPRPLVALVIEEMIAGGERDWARKLLARAEPTASAIADTETLRRLARSAASIDGGLAWAEQYARRCVERFVSGAPILWPRRTAGAALRVAYLFAAGAPIKLRGTSIDAEAYLRTVIAAHPRERIAPSIYVVGNEALPSASTLAQAGIPVVMLGTAPAPSMARLIAEADNDSVIDLVGMKAALGPLLAQRPARRLWTYAELDSAHVAPLITRLLPTPGGSDEPALALHRAELESALVEACDTEAWFVSQGERSAADLTAAWRAAVAAHQAGDIDVAIASYRDLLVEQPGYAPAQHLLGTLLRDRGQRAEAEQAFAAALDAAPLYIEARVALARIYCDDGRTGPAVDLCQDGLATQPNEAALWRGLGLARLAQRRGRLARQAFKQAIALDPTDAETHYNNGVALQLMHQRDAALRSYQRALALKPDFLAADFNVGVIFREKGHWEAAVKAFEEVLGRDPRHVPSYKALAETLLAARRLEEWFNVFDRFEAACPDALPLAVLALQVCQYRADFAKVEHYLERLQRDEFKSTSETELADCLEELLFLLLYFDFEPESQFGLYKAYDAVAPRVYGRPLQLPTQRRPGPIRIGYLSGDLRNHVMGKMMWSAIERHDRERFQLFFYALSSASDKWTARYRRLSAHFEVIADLTEQEAAQRIAADEIDVLVDLATNTHGAKPGILALRPARVQITHVASAGVVGLSTIDFKLTDACADLPETQRTQLETLLPMDGCVYPYRHIAPKQSHPFQRDRLGLARDTVVIGGFVNPLKLSRRCLNLWREIFDRIPNAVLAVSPLSPEMRAVVGTLLSAASIPHHRVIVLPQGRNDAENQGRYEIIDFALDPMPYGGANSTIEALDMGVPVVTLVGRRHGERSTYSILSNLGVTQTIAGSGSEFVDIAVRLAREPAFMAEVKAAIRAALADSQLTNMDAHTRHLEAAYLRALEERYPAALEAIRRD